MPAAAPMVLASAPIGHTIPTAARGSAVRVPSTTKNMTLFHSLTTSAAEPRAAFAVGAGPDSAGVERLTRQIGGELLARAREHRTRRFSSRFWSDRLIQWAVKDPAFKVRLFREDPPVHRAGPRRGDARIGLRGAARPRPARRKAIHRAAHLLRHGDPSRRAGVLAELRPAPLRI